MLAFGADNLLPNGHTWGLWGFGAICYATVVLTVNTRLALEVRYFTWINHLALWGCVAAWFGWMAVYSAFPNFVPSRSAEANMYWVGYTVMSTPSFWLLLLIMPMICIVPDISYKKYVIMPVSSLPNTVCVGITLARWRPIDTTIAQGAHRACAAFLSDFLGNLF